jgi:hypothetical protein
MISVLHLWLGDAPNLGGGGAGSMQRLHSNLRVNNIDSKILCELKSSSDEHVITKPRMNFIEYFIKQFTSRIGLNDIHRVSSFFIDNLPEFRKADIIHFHGIHTGFLSYLALPKLTKTKPSIFTLRDLWLLQVTVLLLSIVNVGKLGVVIARTLIIILQLKETELK